MLTSTCVVPESRLSTSWLAPSLWNAASLAPSGGGVSSRRVLVPARTVVRALRRRARACAAYPKPKQKSRIGTPPPQHAPERVARDQCQYRADTAAAIRTPRRSAPVDWGHAPPSGTTTPANSVRTPRRRRGTPTLPRSLACRRLGGSYAAFAAAIRRRDR